MGKMKAPSTRYQDQLIESFRPTYRPQVTKLLETISRRYSERMGLPHDVDRFMKTLLQWAAPQGNTQYDMEQSLYALQDIADLLANPRVTPARMESIEYILQHARVQGRLKAKPSRREAPGVSKKRPKEPPMQENKDSVQLKISEAIRLYDASLSNPATAFYPKFDKKYVRALVDLALAAPSDAIGHKNDEDPNNLAFFIRSPEFQLTAENLAPLKPRKPSRAEQIQHDLRSEYPDERQKAVRSLSTTLKPESAFKILLIMRNDPHPDVRIAVAAAFGELGTKRATTVLLGLLSDYDPFVRKAAAAALGKIRDPRARLKLSKVSIDDPNSAVRYEANKAYRAIIFSGKPRKKVAKNP